MHALTARAAMVLAELLESDQESIRRTAAQTILRHSEKVNELTRG